MVIRPIRFWLPRLLAALCFAAPSLFAQGTAFDYQGQLNFNGVPANGFYDFGFVMYDAVTVGNQQGPTLVSLKTGVTNGVFNVSLDYGNIFTGANRWLAISVRTNGAGTFILLSPRQQINPAPYAITASSVVPGAISVAMLASGSVTADKIAANSVTGDKIAAASITSDKIAAGAVKPSQIDDLGEGAYQNFQQTLAPLIRAPSIDFPTLAIIAPTNGVNPILRFTINGLGFGNVTGFAGVESISQPYSFVVQGTTTGGSVDPETQIGAVARLEFTRNGKTTYYGGVVTAFTYSSIDNATRIFTVRIESLLSYLARTTDYQVFQDIAVPDIATKVFHDATALNPDARLTGNYSSRENVIQYAESDFNFFSRILEYEGIFYFYDHSTASPNLILGDSVAAYASGPAIAIPFYGSKPIATIPAGAEYIRGFQRSSHQSTGKTTVNAYDFKKPLLNQSASKTAAGVGEHYEFGTPVKTVAYNQTVANNRELRETIERATMTGSSSVPDLRPGFTFILDDRTSAGLSGTYLVTTVHPGGFYRLVNGVSTFYYGNEFEAIPASLAFRPALATPRPTALLSSAVVTGLAGEIVQPDQFARIKVQFHWDRYGSHNELSSSWIRVATPLAGATHGTLFIPRIGDEVLVSFLQGNPDEPVVIGSLFNGANAPPETLPGNKMVSAIKTSATGNGVANEIAFDDTPGKEQLAIQATKDLNLSAVNQLSLSGAISFNGGTPMKRLLSGQTLVGSSTAGKTTVTINFSPAFVNVPKITVTPASGPGWNVDDTFVVTVRTISTTSCVVNILRVDSNTAWSQDLRVNWMAWE